MKFLRSTSGISARLLVNKSNMYHCLILDLFQIAHGIEIESLNHLQIVPIELIIIIFVLWHFVRYIAFIAIGYSTFLLLVQPLYNISFVYIRFALSSECSLVSTRDVYREDCWNNVWKNKNHVRSDKIEMYCWESIFIEKISRIRK